MGAVLVVFSDEADADDGGEEAAGDVEQPHYHDVLIYVGVYAFLELGEHAECEEGELTGFCRG